MELTFEEINDYILIYIIRYKIISFSGNNKDRDSFDNLLCNLIHNRYTDLSDIINVLDKLSSSFHGEILVENNYQEQNKIKF